MNWKAIAERVVWTVIEAGLAAIATQLQPFAEARDTKAAFFVAALVIVTFLKNVAASRLGKDPANPSFPEI